MVMYPKVSSCDPEKCEVPTPGVRAFYRMPDKHPETTNEMDFPRWIPVALIAEIILFLALMGVF